jgi:hypothetical protein
MNTISQKSILIFFLFSLCMVIANVGWGQQSIPTAGVAVTQNFDGMGSSATATLPNGFRVNTTANWSTGTTATTLAYGTTGTGAVTGTSAGGVINWANGITGSSTDRALGFLTSGSFSSPRTILYAFTNNTGSTISEISLAWDYEKYRTGTRAFDWTFFHGATATSVSTAATSGNQSYAADGANAVVNPPTSISKSFSITGLSITNGSTYYLCWTFTGTGGSTNGQGIGIDNFSITLVSPGTPPPTLTADATANTVDNNIDITFTDDATWRAAITAVKVDGNTLTLTTDYEITAGQLRLKPSGLNSNLTTSGTKTVTVEATGYTTASVSQTIIHGVKTNLNISTLPAAPLNNGDALATQPVVQIRDQYNNVCTTDNSSTVTAAVGAGTWTLGGTTTVTAISGVVTFSGLTATSSAAVTGATIVFSSSGLSNVTSNTFNIPPLNQIDVLNFDNDYIQDFNSLANTGTSSTLPLGWYISEIGASANITYTAGTGSSATGDTYSFGSTSAADRALGGLQSGSLNPTIGAKFVNKTGAPITSLSIEYVGEQWRLGATGRADRLDFQYSTDATSLTTGTWTDLDELDFIAPITTGTAGALDGNLPANRVTISGNYIANFPDNTTIWIRWVDFNASGADDGLAIDDLVIHPFILTRSNGSSIDAGTYQNVNVVGTTTLNGNVTIQKQFKFTNAGRLILNNHTVTIEGYIKGPSNFTGSTASGIVVAGSGALEGNINFDQTTPGTSNLLGNLTINRSSQTITLGNAVRLTNTLTLTTGTLATGGNLTLVSNATNEARVAAIGGSASITGNVIAERYIPASARNWRFISPSVSGSNFDDWQNEIYITGTGGSANGFDQTVNNPPGVFWYDETISGNRNSGWISPGNISTAHIVGKGYRVFIRGDRSDIGRLTGTNTTQNAVTMNTIGPLNTGNINMPISFSANAGVDEDGWNLLGNPYASAYNWNEYYDNCTTGCYSNIDPIVWAFDATTNSYLNYNATSSGSLLNGVIPNGASFWVKANAASPTLQFREIHKTALANSQLYKTANNELKLELKQTGSNNADYFILLHKPTASALHDGFDIPKMYGAINVMSFGSDSVMHSLDCRPELSSLNDTIQLHVVAGSGNYSFNIQSMPVSTKYYYLRDKLLNHFILLTANTIYPFTVSSTNAQSSGNRFYIVASNSSSLPVSYASLTAVAVNNESHINWSTASESNTSHFEIERSTNGNDFIKIGKVDAANNSTQIVQYAFIDAYPELENYYRLKQVNLDGKFEYSGIVRVSFTNKVNNYAIWPSPASNLVQINNLTDDEVAYQISNVMGKPVKNGSISATHNSIDIQQLETGVYFINLQTISGNTVLKFVKE